MNNLYEFGGSCDVIIRCNSERTIGGKTYAAGEPYTILRNVFCNLTYRNNTSEGNAKKNIIATRVGLPDVVNISNIQLTNKVCNLISTELDKVRVGRYYESHSDGGTIYLPETPIGDDLFILCDGNNVAGILNEDKITGLPEGNCLIFYSIWSYEKNYDFTTPTYGYFTLEIFGKGNTDKGSDDVYIKFPAVSLMSVPVFDLVNGTILNAPLQFECIHLNQNKSYYVLGV